MPRKKPNQSPPQKRQTKPRPDQPKRPKGSAPGKWVRQHKKAKSQSGAAFPAQQQGEKPPLAYPIRLNRYLSQAGVASRRKADELIEAGVVRVNGQVVTALGTQVEERDRVSVNGKQVSPQAFLYILLNKPTDTITTTNDEKGRKTVLDLIDIPEDVKNGLFPVGRLDRHTKGVLLLTNDGMLANRLMHPRYEIDKLYRVVTEKAVSTAELDQLLAGVSLEDGIAKADQVGYLQGGSLHEIGLKIHEGRNRQVRRMMEVLGHRIVELERIKYGALTTQGVRRGKWRMLKAQEVQKLKRLVKLKAS